MSRGSRKHKDSRLLLSAPQPEKAGDSRCPRQGEPGLLPFLSRAQASSSSEGCPSGAPCPGLGEEEAASGFGAHSKKSPNQLVSPGGRWLGTHVSRYQEQVDPPHLPPAKKISPVCGDTAWELGDACAGGGAEEPPLLWNSEPAPSHRLSAMSSTPCQPTAPAALPGNQGTKATGKGGGRGGRCQPALGAPAGAGQTPELRVRVRGGHGSQRPGQTRGRQAPGVHPTGGSHMALRGGALVTPGMPHSGCHVLEPSLGLQGREPRTQPSGGRAVVLSPGRSRSPLPRGGGEAAFPTALT